MSTDVVILCGGQGTRLKEILPVRPKPMAEFNNRPFLDIIIEQFLNSGFNHHILCLGYGADFIKDYYKQSPFKSHMVFSQEAIPLGTAGAVKNAQNLIQTDHFFVLNGDSYCSADLKAFLNFHEGKQDALASLILAPRDERLDTGGVMIDHTNHLVTAFQEKADNQTAAYISAGIYLFNKTTLDQIPRNQNYSLESSLFPKLVGRGLYGFITTEPVIDIGTPERYQYAQKYFQKR